MLMYAKAHTYRQYIRGTDSKATVETTSYEHGTIFFNASRFLPLHYQHQPSHGSIYSKSFQLFFECISVHVAKQQQKFIALQIAHLINLY